MSFVGVIVGAAVLGSFLCIGIGIVVLSCKSINFLIKKCRKNNSNDDHKGYTRIN